ncbi:metallophosphoesterase [Gottfriedia solisilvae]|uniref:metallophosphoesterase n=1 Tax=Gottfriedia solisilvae TaxID=1516104 RepID=UPI003D2EF306
MGKITIALVVLSSILIVYTVWDNSRIILINQNNVVDHLPSDLEDFKILQVTDLHGKEFGKNQSQILKKINSLDYDAIVFTGDMLDHRKNNRFQPFYQLLDGIHNKENAIFIPGNEDPESYCVNSQGKLEKSEFIKGIEKRGVTFLESVYSLKIREATIRFVDFELSIQSKAYPEQQVAGIFKQEIQRTKQYDNHRKQLLEEMTVLDQTNGEDILIALNHNPVVDARINQLKSDPKLNFRNYDLIIAGHYHGGQIRLPFVGALFVPEAWNERNGLFPPQDRVKGLWEYKDTKQYVSTGLGSSDAIPILKFRLFNPPEINIITLKQSK